MSVLILAFTPVSNIWAMARMKLPPDSDLRRFLGCQNLKLPRFENLFLPPTHRGKYYDSEGHSTGLNKLFFYCIVPGPVKYAGCNRDKEGAGEAAGDLSIRACGGC